MKKYENYKSTEIPWVSQVPSHWALIRNGNILILKHNVVGDRHTQFDLLSLTTGGIRIKNADDTRGKVPASFENYQEVLPGDMVFCLFDLDCSAVFSGKSEYHGMITSAYDVAMPNLKLVSSSYLDYWFCTVFSGRYYKIYSKSVRYTITWEIFKALKTPIPPRDEQDQIVRYLDWQVSKINRLISAKRKQIELLKEHKEAFINTAVTRGIVGDIPLKESGLQWLPKIPAHWKPVPAKALFRNISELRHEDDPMLAATQKYGLIEQAEYMRRENRRIVLANDNLDKWLHVEPNDFIISLRSFQGGLEKCDKPGCVTWHYVVLRPQQHVYPPFYKWFFKSASYIGALQKTSDFIRDGQDLRFSNFVKVGLFVIPMAEQVKIADRLDSEIPKYQKAIDTLEKEIQQIIEYRTRLISDVVTGQIDVRGIEIPEYSACNENASIDQETEEDLCEQEG